MPPYGIRRGFLPLLIGFSLREFCDIVTISFKGKEIPLSASLLSQMVEDSEGYSLRLDQNTTQRKRYLEELYALFLPDTLQSRSVYPLVEVMQQWARSLSEYTKYFTVNPSGTPFPRIFQGLRKELLQFELNQREFVWESIPRLLETEGDVPKTVEKLQEFVALLTEHLHQVQEHLVHSTCGLLPGSGTENLRQRLILWRESVTEPLSDGKSRELSHFVQWLPYEEEEILTHLVRIFVGTPLEEWNDQCATNYVTACERCLSMTSNQCQQEEKIIEPIAISALGETLKSNLFELLEEYQDALEREEKKAILSSLLEELQ